MRSYIFYFILLSFFSLGIAGHWSRAEHGIAAFDFLNETFKEEQPVIASDTLEVQGNIEAEIEIKEWADILTGGWEFTEDYNGENPYHYEGGISFGRDGTFARVLSIENESGNTKSAIRIDGLWAVVSDTTKLGKTWAETVKTCYYTVSSGNMCSQFPKGKTYFFGLTNSSDIQSEIKEFTNERIRIVGKDISNNSEYYITYKKI